LNNVVLKFHDNTIQQFNNLFGKTRTLSGTGVNAGKCIIGAWIKSGCNSSTDGPNYGAYFENDSYNNECAAALPCGPFFSLKNASWEFCMQTPSGIINRNDLAINNNFTYDGSASSVYFYAVAGGGNVIVNGTPFAIQPNKYYLFTGNIQVKVNKNDPSAPGQWMICITTNSSPYSGSGTNRPLSPCEESLNAPNNPTNNLPNNKNPQGNPSAKPNAPTPGGRTKPTGPGNTQPNSGGKGSGSSSTPAPSNPNSGGKGTGTNPKPAPANTNPSSGGKGSGSNPAPANPNPASSGKTPAPNPPSTGSSKAGRPN
jgi:hypothetical protein